jgi:GntR family transcriptional regulator
MPTTNVQPVPRARGVSLHHQLFLVLRDRIVSGDYPGDSLIPTEEELCSYFSVSRITVRRALADLEAEGFVWRRQGRGTFVRDVLPAAREAATLNFVESLHKTAEETRVTVLDVETVIAPPQIAQRLHLATGARAVHAIRLRRKDNTPILVSDAWVPETYGRTMTTATLKKRAMYELLLEQGIKFGRVVQEITALSADPTFAQWLGVETGVPLLRVSRIVYDGDRTPVQHVTLTVNPENSRIVVDMLADSVNTLRTGQFVHDTHHASLVRNRKSTAAKS